MARSSQREYWVRSSTVGQGPSPSGGRKMSVTSFTPSRRGIMVDWWRVPGGSFERTRCRPVSSSVLEAPPGLGLILGLVAASFDAGMFLVGSSTYLPGSDSYAEPVLPAAVA